MIQKQVEAPILHVLVVEDDVEQREMMVAVLTRMGCRVDSAKDGDEAFRLARDGRPRVILMDLHLPSMSGWEAIRNLRERARMTGDAQAPHIIAYSAFGKMEARQAAFDAGANEFIAKPLDVRGAIRAYALRHGHALEPLGDDVSTAS